MERLFDVRDTNRRHFFLITFIIVFEFVAHRHRMIVDTAIVQPLLTRKRIKQHFDRHEVADFHRLVKMAVSQCRIVIPVVIDAVVDSKRNRDVSPVHVKRVEFEAVLADVIAELEAGIVCKVVHERSLQIRKFVIQIQIQKPYGIAQVENVADISRAASKHPTRRALVPFGMELGGKRADLYARLAEPFFHGILTACATVHLEHGTQAVAVLRRESALVELHIVNAFDEERTEKPEEMHRRIDDRVIEQKQVLVGGTATHVNLGTEIGTRDNARERLDALDDVCFGKARHALDRFRGDDGFARLALGAATQLHHDFLEFGHFRVRAAGGEERIDVDVGGVGRRID